MRLDNLYLSFFFFYYYYNPDLIFFLNSENTQDLASTKQIRDARFIPFE